MSQEGFRSRAKHPHSKIGKPSVLANIGRDVYKPMGVPTQGDWCEWSDLHRYNGTRQCLPPVCIVFSTTYHLEAC